MDGTRYPSKVDLWLALLVGLPMGLLLVLAAYMVMTGELLGFSLLLGPALTWMLAWPTEYVLAPEDLQIRSGFIRYRVPYGEIDLVQPSRSPLSAPAWSLDRLEIKYGRKAIMISPEDKGAFLSDLAGYCRKLRRDGDRLVPR